MGLSAAVASSSRAASSPGAASSPRALCHRRRFVTGRFLPTLNFSVSYTRYVASFTKQNRLPAGGSSSGEASVDRNKDGDNDSDDDSRAIPEAGPSCPACGPLAIFAGCSRASHATAQPSVVLGEMAQIAARACLAGSFVMLHRGLCLLSNTSMCGRWGCITGSYNDRSTSYKHSNVSNPELGRPTPQRR